MGTNHRNSSCSGTVPIGRPSGHHSGRPLDADRRQHPAQDAGDAGAQSIMLRQVGFSLGCVIEGQQLAAFVRGFAGLRYAVQPFEGGDGGLVGRDGGSLRGDRNDDSGWRARAQFRYLAKRSETVELSEEDAYAAVLNIAWLTEIGVIVDGEYDGIAYLYDMVGASDDAVQPRSAALH